MGNTSHDTHSSSKQSWRAHRLDFSSTASKGSLIVPIECCGLPKIPKQGYMSPLASPQTQTLSELPKRCRRTLPPATSCDRYCCGFAQDFHLRECLLSSAMAPRKCKVSGETLRLPIAPSHHDDATDSRFHIYCLS